MKVAAQWGVLIVPIRTVDSARPTRGDSKHVAAAVPAKTFMVSRRDRILTDLLPMALLLLSHGRAAAPRQTTCSLTLRFKRIRVCAPAHWKLPRLGPAFAPS